MEANQLFKSFCNRWLCICLCAGGEVSLGIGHTQFREIIGEVTVLRTGRVTWLMVHPVCPFYPVPVTLVPVPSICSRLCCFVGRSRSPCCFPVGRGQTFLRGGCGSCSSTPSCQALSTHSWPFVCSLWVTGALPSTPTWLYTLAYLSGNSSLGQGPAFGNASFFSLIQLCLVLTCSAMLCRLTVHLGANLCPMMPVQIRKKTTLHVSVAAFWLVDVPRVMVFEKLGPCRHCHG